MTEARPVSEVAGNARIAAVLCDLASRRAPATVCPSEVARALAADWRPLMERVRLVAALLPDIVATRSGATVEADAATGPIRLGLRMPEGRSGDAR